MILSAAVPALAADTMNRDIRTGTTTVGLNNYAVIGEFTTDQNQSITPSISFTVFTIGNNGPVYYDILLMDEANYTSYKNNQNFSYIAAGSKIGQSGESVSVSNLALAQHTHYFLVADNTNLPAGGSTPTQDLRIGYVLTGFNMSVQFPTGNVVALALIAIVVIVLLVIVVIALVLLFIFMRRRNGNRQPIAPAPVMPLIKPATAEGNCPVCGKPVAPDFMVCPNCGNRLK
jgi:ABC-type multidrug transport system permease subunit